MNVASTWKRIAARSVDQLLLALILMPVMFNLTSHDGWIYIPYTVALALAVIPAAYEAIFYYLMKATPGKWVFNLKVVPVSHSEKNWGARVLLRATASYLSLFFGWAVYATAFLNRERRHVGDWLAETRVVGEDEMPPMKVRAILALILIVVGVSTGLFEARTRFGMMSFEKGQVRMPDPFDFSQMVPAEED